MRRAAALAVGALVLVTASCTGQTSRPAAESAASITSAASQATDSPSPVPTAAPTKGNVKPLVDTCPQARTITTPFPEAGDLVIGPLSYGGLRHAGAAPLKEPNWGSGYFYKSGAQLRSGMSATVSIEGPATAYAAIVTESGQSRGSRAVTYRGCARSGPTGYWWVGGFVLWGRRTACVPIVVTSPSDSTRHRAVVSLGAGDCD